MTYLLDTNACVEFLNHRDSAVTRKLSEMRREDIVLCPIR
jgi:predicted nucleic acid-binding protein